MNTEKTYKTDDGTLVHALRILARDIKSPDNIANLAISEAADRIESLAKAALENEKKANELSVKLAIAVEALRPFADEHGEWNGIPVDDDQSVLVSDDYGMNYIAKFSFGDLRRAAAVVAEMGGVK